MSEPLDLEPIRERWSFRAGLMAQDQYALLAEVERLRAELARRDEQIAVRVIEAVRSMPLGYRPEDVANELEHADLRGTLDGLS